MKRSVTAPSGFFGAGKTTLLNPERLMVALRGNTLQQVLRSKGTLWLATRVERAAQWSKVGRYVAVTPGAQWLAAVPRAQWPQTPEVDRYLTRYWHDAVGDCR